MRSSKWKFIQAYGHYVDFDKEVMSCNDTGDTTLDVRLTFNTEARSAYMTVAWHNDDGDKAELDGERKIEWDAALRMLHPDIELPKELQ